MLYLLVQLETPVMAKGNVELWLGDLLNQAMNSLHVVIREAYHAINDGGFSLMNFLGQFASQVCQMHRKCCLTRTW